MKMIGEELETFFAPAARLSKEDVTQVSEELREEFLLPWFDAVPVSILVLNEHRQIVFSNNTFNELTEKQLEEIIGMRPGEALDCVHSNLVEAGCGCSSFCNTCGAANAIIKSMGGENDCQDCRLIRLVNDAEAPLDLQVFTKPVTFRDQQFVFLFAMDVSHELRLRYLNNTFYHGLINASGGLNTLTQMMEEDNENNPLFPLLATSSKRILRDVIFHNDLSAGEEGRLGAIKTSFNLPDFIDKLVEEECEIRNVQPLVVERKYECGDIHTDKRILGHVIRCMLVNALESLQDKCDVITLSAVTGESGRTVLTIENCGEIPENIAKHIFKRYISTKSPERGLGTYVIKLFTERYLDGNAEFSSQDGRTTFSIRLPK
ncbi:ATP-binding protein [Pseudodesulfovibrio sp. zrk46]|uniref:sensor histidine kinase n=1 Tax=Pseudodesulfovibrio sp. zrk46 TaxID=2725288 RepID=UPI00144A1E41|nr:ATP-binding protein [Pseudodesulfovibrio sp. zrk46]QJB55979.1 sensor histidine kinase [Pseudodesulfovibrio sp. zrk46]